MGRCHLVLVLAASCRASLSVFDSMGFRPYPWGERAIASAKATVAYTWKALIHGCPGNRTLFAGYTYAHFSIYLQDANIYKLGLEEYNLQPVLRLIGRRHLRNRHLPLCAVAVIKALQMWRLHLLSAVSTEHVGDTHIWTSAMKELDYVGDVLGILTCAWCNGHEQLRFRTLVDRSGWRLDDDWIAHGWFVALAELRGLVQGQQTLASLIAGASSSRNTGDAHHLALFRDGQVLLERLRAAKLLHSWVVARGTMIFAMRYGHTRGVPLPSGHLDLPKLPPLDMDVYVLTDDWDALLLGLVQYAKALSFDWCGWQTGWPTFSVFCLREGAELELSRVESWSAPSMLPATRCLVQAVPAASADEDAAGEPAADGGQAQEPLELPCPHNPMGFMRTIWAEQHRKELLECLPLPVTLDGVLQSVAEDDVRFLWARAVQLHRLGYASMLPYFKECHSHPLASLANSLPEEEPWSI